MSGLKPDFQKQTDDIVNALEGKRPRLLLHCCCGPCGTYVFEYLCRYFDVTALFFNPNIQPEPEYEKRRLWLMRVVEKYGGRVETAECGYEPERFAEAVRGLEAEPEGGKRCAECFKLRLGETAKRAASGGFDRFCSTLTVSPHKDAGLINNIGLELEGRFGVKWLPSDFKKRDGYKRSIELSREYDLYRQDYCGCAFSLQKSGKKEEEN